jgi:hypothetical protein
MAICLGNRAGLMLIFKDSMPVFEGHEGIKYQVIKFNRQQMVNH